MNCASKTRFLPNRILLMSAKHQPVDILQVDLDVERTLPSAIIVLNSPLNGPFEANLIRSIYNRTASPPFVVAADGAGRWVHQAGLAQYLDIVCGDMDSFGSDALGTSIKAAASIQRTYKTACDAVRSSSDWFPQVAATRGGGAWIEISDQDSTDFDKCLAITHHIQESSSSELVNASTAMMMKKTKESRRHRVAVVGAFGDRWDHWFACIHSISMYADSPSIELLLVHERNIMAFCATRRATRFLVRDSHRGFAVVPLGYPPKQISTKGLKWDINSGDDAPTMSTPPSSSNSSSRFDFGFVSRPFPPPGGHFSRPFISTSNEVAAGTSEVTVRLNGNANEDLRRGGEAPLVAVISFQSHASSRL